MSWFKALKPDSLRDLFVHELKATYDVEQKQLDGLQTLAKYASDPDLKAMFDRHYTESMEQVARLERCFTALGLPLESDTSAAVRGVASEIDTATSMKGDDATRDAALIMVAQCAEHLEIARYGTLRTWARFLGHHDIAEQLQRTLEEERAFDQQLSDLAEAAVNVDAVR